MRIAEFLACGMIGRTEFYVLVTIKSIFLCSHAMAISPNMAIDQNSRTARSTQPERCYLCDTPLRHYRIGPGEKAPPDSRTRDHVPPEGLFPSPKPNNLFTVPCCSRCNNLHSVFDERLRIAASMPFDRNSAGQRILEEKVVRGTLAKGRQMAFVARLLESRNGTEEHSNLIRMEMEVREFQDGIIRITKGMLRCLHPQFDYKKSTFLVVAIHPEPVDEQLKLMAALKQGAFLERGQKVFQCWRHIEESRGGGAWMLVFFECFGFFVFHTNGPELVTVEG